MLLWIRWTLMVVFSLVHLIYKMINLLTLINVYLPYFFLRWFLLLSHNFAAIYLRHLCWQTGNIGVILLKPSSLLRKTTDTIYNMNRHVQPHAIRKLCYLAFLFHHYKIFWIYWLYLAYCCNKYTYLKLFVLFLLKCALTLLCEKDPVFYYSYNIFASAHYMIPL